jgi:hypothetical protein
MFEIFREGRAMDKSIVKKHCFQDQSKRTGYDENDNFPGCIKFRENDRFLRKRRQSFQIGYVPSERIAVLPEENQRVSINYPKSEPGQLLLLQKML